ncbi:MAG: leucine-rich repeat protein [Lachnospiraceae bacterium]|nr:leucine-rich repeat protein [Lachnospiraceae bacterium]
MRKKIISAFLVGVLGFCNCSPALAMENQESRVVSNETPVKIEQEKQVWEEMVTSEMPCDMGDLGVEEKEMIGTGHSFGSATNVSLNREVVDSLIDGASKYYIFTLPQNGKINIDFSHELFESSLKCWKIFLYDYNHNEIDVFYSSDGYTKSVKSFDYGLSAGKYYLEIYPSCLASETYSFKVNYNQDSRWETEFNNNWLTADTVQLNNEYYGSMPDGSSDYYIFTLPKDGKINIDFSHELFESSLKCWKIFLYDYNHNEIDYFYSSDGYTKSVKSFDYGLSAGKYYLEIYPSCLASETYSFKINTKPALNETFKYGSAYFKVKKDGLVGEVQFVKPTSKTRTAYTIPSKIKYRGFEYNVVSVASDAFKDNKKLKSVTIGKNVTVLGNNVFYGCKNLKNITVKSTKLKKVGSKSLKGIYKKAVIKVPKSKLSKYKKLFKGKGQSKTVKVKKL